MKLRASLVALFVFGLAVSVALADPGHGQGKKDDPIASSTESASTTTATTTTTEESKGPGKHGAAAAAAACWPKVSFILRGTLVSYGGETLTMDVTKANRHGRMYVGKQVSLEVGEWTEVRRHGPAKATDLEKDDLLKVHVRACKNQEAGTNAAAELYARHVIARASKPEESDEVETTTATTATTTTEATTQTTTTTG